jgi:hypothetical protein
MTYTYWCQECQRYDVTILWETPVRREWYGVWGTFYLRHYSCGHETYCMDPSSRWTMAQPPRKERRRPSQWGSPMPPHA